MAAHLPGKEAARICSAPRSPGGRDGDRHAIRRAVAVSSCLCQTHSPFVLYQPNFVLVTLASIHRSCLSLVTNITS